VAGVWWTMFCCRPTMPGTNPKIALSAHTPSPNSYLCLKPPNWLFQFLALYGASSPIRPTLSQPLGSLQQVWGVEPGGGAGSTHHPTGEDRGLSCLPPSQSARVLDHLTH
jgi:hypothetical protein